MEQLHRARDGIEYEILFTEIFESLLWIPAGDRAFERAFAVQRAMASTTDGNHRRPAIDYLVAAAAELAGPEIVVWAFDRDLQLICEHTGQPHEIEAAA